MAVPRVYIYFNKDLTPYTLYADEFVLRYNSWIWSLTNALARVDRAQADLVMPQYFDGGPDRIRYKNLRNELRDCDGLPVAAFFFLITRTD